MKPERNVPCPCGSGKKYKKCCGSEERANVLRAEEKARKQAEIEEKMERGLDRMRGRLRAQAAIAMVAALGTRGRP